ncbi:hypothetical protein GALMADRAFT_479544 [Galerina marginata CBS 339.88]|uniref:Uncharacterized protein n=1 Tax=Galerina marginata (strain CBS 339.88) TaxID=685588 RepID=A0A067SZQ6_GALM3|nr:hypothetical protein GALMADRAFT_479544 [Galerina marginata CBS 339.88]
MPMSFPGLAQPISGAIPPPVPFPAVVSLWCSTCLLFRHVTFLNVNECHENDSASARIIFSIGLFLIFLNSNCW